MKNREKFRNGIKSALETNSICSFIRDFVEPKPFNNMTADEFCDKYNCIGCSKMFAFWLDEEYEETPKPEVDWDNVPVDTLVRVRDEENEEWILQYFKGVDEKSSDLRYLTWVGGATSVTARGNYTRWAFCELVEEEHEEPEVDWNDVPVDTLVRVRDNEYHEWSLQYFARFNEDEALQFVTWPSGTTSKTAKGSRVAWRFCELAEVTNGK